jgi:hypothetical protein
LIVNLHDGDHTMSNRMLLVLVLVLSATTVLAGPYPLAWTGDLVEGTTVRILGFFAPEDPGPPGAPGQVDLIALRAQDEARLQPGDAPVARRVFPALYAIRGDAPEFAACTDTLHLGPIAPDEDDGLVTWRGEVPTTGEVTIFLSRTDGLLADRTWETATLRFETEGPGQPGAMQWEQD